MDVKKIETRNSALDIVRIVAVFTVVSVHFFLYNGFYYETVQGAPMYIMCLMRTLFSVCVPMFMVLTGYLMSNKTLSKKYYSGIAKTLVVFVIATIACMVFKTFHDGNPFNAEALIFGILDFTGANYSWYIEMYIGLFLIAPFLNLAYHKLNSQRQKQVLVFTFVAITILPTLFNIFNFQNPQWWLDPKLSDEFQKLYPNWWMGFYPVAYYFTGCYFREYGMKIKTRTLLITFVIAIVLFGSFNFYRSYGTTFKSGIYVYWYGFESYVLTSFLFVLLSRIKTDKLGNGLKVVLWKISDLALGIYLLSYIFDSLVYPVLNDNITTMTDRLPFYFVTVPIVFICSAAASFIANLLAKYAIMLYGKIVAFIKNQRQREDKSKWQDYLYIALIAGAIAFALWKCFYGFGGNDEAFYLTVPHRLSMGDALIRDEWHLSQLSGFLLLPFVSLYKLIMGSTEGIIITARVVYVIFHAVISLVIYSRIRKYGYITVFASVLYFLFTPYDIMTMSYNTMGLDLIAVTGVIMGTASYQKKLPLIISGFTFAGAVLCSPYLISAYILFGLCVIVHYIIRKKNLKFVLSSKLFSVKTFLWFTLGVAVLGAAFLIFTLTRVSISEITQSLPYLLTDPEHPSIALGTRIYSYFNSIFTFQNEFKFALFSYLAMIVVMIFDRKRKLHRSLYLIITSAVVIFCYVIIIPNLITTYYNALMFPIIFIGITSYILCEKKPKNLFVSLFVLGIIYSVAICFSSNQYFFVISMAISASNIASYVFLARLLREMNETEDNLDYAVLLKRSSFVMVAFMILLQAGFQINVKANHCFWEPGNTTVLTSQITSGPAKGIYTNAQNAQSYQQIYSDLQEYNNKERDKILFLTPKTWCYLAVNDFPYGTLSAWLSGENQTSIDRLKSYYSINPDKTPKYIYIPKDSSWDLTNIYVQAQALGYNVTENSVSYKLKNRN